MKQIPCISRICSALANGAGPGQGNVLVYHSMALIYDGVMSLTLIIDIIANDSSARGTPPYSFAMHKSVLLGRSLMIG